jgi:hypothetical protein
VCSRGPAVFPLGPGSSPLSRCVFAFPSRVDQALGGHACFPVGLRGQASLTPLNQVIWLPSGDLPPQSACPQALTGGCPQIRRGTPIAVAFVYIAHANKFSSWCYSCCPASRCCNTRFELRVPLCVCRHVCMRALPSAMFLLIRSITLSASLPRQIRSRGHCAVHSEGADHGDLCWLALNSTVESRVAVVPVSPLAS